MADDDRQKPACNFGGEMEPLVSKQAILLFSAAYIAFDAMGYARNAVAFGEAKNTRRAVTAGAIAAVGAVIVYFLLSLI